MTRPCRALSLVILPALLLGAAEGARACFGTRLRIGVQAGTPAELPALATGYFLEERAGITPEFVEIQEGPARALAGGRVDLVIAPASAPAPEGVVERPAGPVPGLGPARYWIRPTVLEDLRFTLVDRALGRIPGLFRSGAFRRAVGSGDPPRRAARRAVLDAP